MRSIPSALQAKLDSGVTTLCRCWIITRNDGVTQGVTEHDEDVVLGDVTCRAGSGLTGSEATAKLGMRWTVRKCPARSATIRSTRTISPPGPTTRPGADSGGGTGARRN